ncbi:DUF6285 domain-containing protein [Paraburkholderia sp. USG1]|uniref:DUF6285 domain-containing protein n=1 Tax=Paraburkholderia sp. USG1 TaxID=2952268 RepID=UPI00285E5335|nr:DUF6285 domain-containing protein [Paraburkholderia sp. USG1]MDR8397123.1 DUF6285 domain-containing protein [Paraburkholderia sp. USG1]
MEAPGQIVDLLEIAHSTLTADVLPLLKDESRYRGLMVSNAMCIVARHVNAAFRLTAPLPLLGDVAIAGGIRAGQFDGGSPMRSALVANLRNRLVQELSIDNPRMLETLQNSERTS